MANAWLYFVGMTQHTGLRDNVPDFRLCVRTIQLDSLTSFLYWRMERHIEHHMFAGVPCYNLKRLSLEIADDMPAPRSLLGAWREMRSVWQRQQNRARLPVRHAAAADGPPGDDQRGGCGRTARPA